jgi:N-carbamoyl-L-amino-acid hydrolase
MRNLQVKGERLWVSLMAVAEIGAHAKGGACRLAASDLDGKARLLFIRWCEPQFPTSPCSRVSDGDDFEPAADYIADSSAILI